MTFDLSTLNENQREAVLHTAGPLAILSVAGSGKTRTMVSKIEYLLNEVNVLPSRLWACTFTNKAADEMRERLEKNVGEKADKIKLSTLHSLSYQIYKAGMRSREPHYKMPTILAHEGRALGHIFKFCNEKKLNNRDAKGYLSDIAQLKLALITPEQYKKNFNVTLDTITVTGYNSDCITYHERTYHVYKEYENWKKKNDLIDFQDMLVNCYNLLINPRYEDFKNNLIKKCEYILVDECQDTNTVCFKILEILASHHNNVTIVGDLRQSIYGFQGAEISNVKEFISKFNPKIIDLNINYRSSSNIVQNANRVISYATDIIGKQAETPNEEGSPIYYVTNGNSHDEADTVCNIVDELIAEGNEYRDIAILYRVHSQSRMVEDQFIINGTPYITFTKQTFYERKEIKDLIAYLKVFVFPEETNISTLKRIMNRPVRFISNQAMDALEYYALDTNQTIWDALTTLHESDMDWKHKQALEKLYDDLRVGITRYKSGKTCNELCRFVLDELNYEEWATTESKVRDADSDIELNFDAIIDSMSIYDDPCRFLNHVEAVKKEESKKKDETGDYIKMMSIHASKGREFKNVIILGLCDRIYPFHRSVAEGNSSEERRVMYVALTRPQQRLYLSVIHGNLGRFKVLPSPYLQQMTINYTGGSNVRG